MRWQRFIIGLTVALLVGWATVNRQAGQAFAVQPKKEKDKNEGKKGKTVGVLVAKGENFIEVQADGEEKARKYVPQWKGGVPAKGGGFDKEMLKTFRTLKIGSRIQVSWLFQERLRALAIEVLVPPEKKE